MELFEQFAVAFELSSGKPNGEEQHSGLWLGITTRETSAGSECATVLDGGPAQSAGVNPGDVIIALGRLRATTANLESLLARYNEGDEASLTVFRGNELLEFPLQFTAAPRTVCALSLRKDADSAQIERRRNWLDDRGRTTCSNSD
jgi:predicted metalloprotease with PDZ domain